MVGQGCARDPTSSVTSFWAVIGDALLPREIEKRTGFTRPRSVVLGHTQPRRHTDRARSRAGDPLRPQGRRPRAMKARSARWQRYAATNIVGVSLHESDRRAEDRAAGVVRHGQGRIGWLLEQQDAERKEPGQFRAPGLFSLSLREFDPSRPRRAARTGCAQLARDARRDRERYPRSHPRTSVSRLRGSSRQRPWALVEKRPSTSSGERTFWASVTPPQMPESSTPPLLRKLLAVPEREDHRTDLEESDLLSPISTPTFQRAPRRRRANEPRPRCPT